MITSNTTAAAAGHTGTTRAEDRPDWFPLAAGGALALLALSKRSTLLKLAVVCGGGYLLARAVQRGSLRIPTNFDSLRLPSDLVQRFGTQFQKQGSQRFEPERYPEGADLVDETSIESFPGSDPPGHY